MTYRESLSKYDDVDSTYKQEKHQQQRLLNFTHASIDNDDGKDTREYHLRIFNLHHFEQSDSDDDTN
ncbi:hypothetical protein DERF_002905 [Dermatophagoides farinae]|uniref:Uncharacterized protein n=1 Tax=Dermatophagoides farinae TaxID=6954 RepID=A0A922IBI8_DERFA|nr:hypothetical protein DERF_002905 [Dermatophagoides farinae]